MRYLSSSFITPCFRPLLALSTWRNQLFAALRATVVVGNRPLVIQVKLCHFAHRGRKFCVFTIPLFALTHTLSESRWCGVCFLPHYLRMRQHSATTLTIIQPISSCFKKTRNLKRIAMKEKRERKINPRQLFFLGNRVYSRLWWCSIKKVFFSIIVCLSVPPPPLSYQSYSKMPGGMSLFDVKRVEGEKNLSC